MKYGELIVKILPPRRAGFFRSANQRELIKPLEFYPQHEDFPDHMYVEEGFITDFASIPGIARGLLDHGTEKPAVHHDKGCRDGYLWTDGEVPVPISRTKNDKLFRIGLLAEGNSRKKAYTLYAAVRANSAYQGTKGWVETYLLRR